MTPKRKTIDSIIGTRIRARTYADSYVPKSISGKLVNDILDKPHTHDHSAHQNHIDLLAIEKAKQLISLPKPTLKPISSQHAHSVAITTLQSGVIRPKYISQKSKSLPNTLQAQLVKARQPLSDTETTVPVIGDMVRQIQKVEASRSDRINLDESGEIIANSGVKHRVELALQNMFASRRSIAMSAMSVLLLVGGTVALASSFTTNKAVGSQVKALSEKANADVNESLGATDSDSGIPSEEKVPESVVNSYKPPADEPRYIHIPKIKNSKTRVLKMGVGKDNAVQTPRTTWDMGWFEESSKPGDKVGSALIVGHVSGLTGGGVFYNLYRLTDGDEIIVEMGDGTKYTYRVVSKEEVPADGLNMNNYLVSKNIDKPGLTLMTCAGEYNPVTQTYENRLAVFAVREP